MVKALYLPRVPSATAQQHCNQNVNDKSIKMEVLSRIGPPRQAKHSIPENNLMLLDEKVAIKMMSKDASQSRKSEL